jgi:hypothetical protein
MPTNTAGSAARQHALQLVHYLRKGITFSDLGDGALTVGILPSGAQIHKSMSGVFVNVAFNSSGTDLLDIGTTANDDLYATDLDLSSIAFVALDEAVDMSVSADTTITCTAAQSVADATAGSGEVVICYIPDNDG